jgi:hypothetical protein
MKKALLYIHGKGGSAEEANHYQKMLPDYDIFGLDYQKNTPWETKEEFLNYYKKLTPKYKTISIIANSIGAYFAMNALSKEKIEQAFFISPIVDMEKLIKNMMFWAKITEQELEEKKEIKTSFGEVLSWQYFCYVRQNPILWNNPTHLLYGAKDNLTDFKTISAFAGKINASLKIMPNGEHWFHTDEQMAFLDNWLKQYL